MEDERSPALFGRILAVSTMVEVVTFALLAEQSDPLRKILLATLRSAAKDIGVPGTMSDEAAVFMSDARIHGQAALEAMVERVEAMLLQANS